ncbi:MAG: chloride channel protein [Phycisphaeraceae bacterium]|nr:chloride channel protein [Phycisphaeraceae bacterium]
MTWHRFFSSIGIGPESGMRSLGRTIALAGLVGIVAAVGAAMFHSLCLLVQGFSLETLAHYRPGGPRHETEVTFIARLFDGREGLLRPWMLVVMTSLGGLISGLLVFKFAPEAEGHGTDAAIRAYHHNRGYIRPRVPLIKMLASAITLGTGGSGGREGPIAQIGAGFGSFLGTRLRLSDSERRILLATGLGAGIGAIFHAPLAGAIFSIEVLYRDPDFEAEALIPAFIGTTVAFSVFGLIFNIGSFNPLFEVPVANLTYAKPLLLLPPLAVLAIVMAGASWFYVHCFYSTQKLFKNIPLPNWSKPAIGGLLTGLVALTLFYLARPLGQTQQQDTLSVLSFGYGFLQKVLISDIPHSIAPAIAILLIVGLGKILTTSLTIGSGGSGGVFGPSMVIGGCLGAVIGVLFHALLPGVVAPGDIVLFAILGMASFFSAAANTPVSTLIIVSELCNSYALLLPSMWVCAISYIMSRPWTIYREQVVSRLDSPAHRGDFIIDILKGIAVREAVTEQHRRFIQVNLDTPLSELSRLITSCVQDCFPVVNEDGCYYGLFSLNDLRQFLYDSDLGALAVAHDLATAKVTPLTLQMDLSSAISRFAQGRFDELPVIDEAEPDKVLAMLRRQDVIALYDKRLLELRTEAK